MCGLGGVPVVSGALQWPARQAVIPRVGAGSVQVGSACWTVAPAGGQGEAGLGHGWSPPPHSQIKSPFRHKGEVLLAGHGDILGTWVAQLCAPWLLVTLGDTTWPLYPMRMRGPETAGHSRDLRHPFLAGITKHCVTTDSEM